MVKAKIQNKRHKNNKTVIREEGKPFTEIGIDVVNSSALLLSKFVLIFEQ